MLFMGYFNSLWGKLTILCFTYATYVCFYYCRLAILPLFLCSLFYLKGTKRNRIETITILWSTILFLVNTLQQFLGGHWWHLKAQNTFFDTFWHSRSLSAWLTAVGCFIFGTAVLIYLFPVWYLSMSKNRLNISDTPGSVTGLH